MTATETKALERDAKRYRFLRSEASRGKNDQKRCLSVEINDWAKNFDPKARTNIWSCLEVSGGQMDAEIDKAMSRVKRNAKK